MKRSLLILSLALAPACHTMGAICRIPEAVVSDVGGVVETVVPGEATPEAEAIGSTVGTGATLITGNPALGALAGGLATAVAMLVYGKRKKKPAA